MPIREDFERLPTWGQIGVFAVLCLLIGLGYNWFFYQDKVAQKERLRRQQQELISKVQEGQTAKRNYEKLKAEIARYQNLIEQLKKILPTDLEIQNVFSDVSNKAKETGLQMTSFKPQSPVEAPGQPYRVYPLKILIEGSYHAFGEFTERIAMMDRLVNIESFQISVMDPDQRPPRLKFDVTVHTYTYIEATENQTPGSPAGRPRR